MSPSSAQYLLSLLHKKLPITDADSVRALACRALVGLSRSDAARQIMSKLPVFTQGQLQLLMREPILQEKRADHVNFQRYGLELINAVSGKRDSAPSSVTASIALSMPGVTNSSTNSTSNNRGSSTTSGNNNSSSQQCLVPAPAATSVSSDISLLSIHKADVVAQTKIGYNKKQLLQLMQLHLLREGLLTAAHSLQVGESYLPANVWLLFYSRQENKYQSTCLSESCANFNTKLALSIQ